MKLLLLLLLLTQEPEVKAPPKPLPPDLVHVQSPSCTVLEHEVAEVFNAKTGKTDEITNFRVEPYATYDDNRDRWELPKEQIYTSNQIRPGAIGEYKSSHDAVDACFDWIKSVKAAKMKEIEKLGHSSKKK